MFQSILKIIHSISGSINKNNEIKKENMYRKERYVGRFQRAITLPCPVSHEAVKASYKNGGLEVIMPKMRSKKLTWNFINLIICTTNKK